MHLRGSIHNAQISGIASRLRRRGLGDLGMTSAEIYNEVIAQGGSTSDAEAASRSGSLDAWNAAHQSVQPDWFRNLYYAPKPSVTLSSSGVAPYTNLSDKPLSFAGVTWPTAILNPHTTTALNWVQPNVLNKGAPTSLYDPIEFLRSALIDSDWDRVFYWFAVQYAQLYKQFENSRDAFYPFANMNILSYKYVINDNGQKVYYPFSQYDLWQFISRIVANFSITDLGVHGKCAIGLLNWGDPYHVVPYDVANELTGPNQWWNAINQGLLDVQHPSSVFQYTSLKQANVDSQIPRTAAMPLDDIRVGWIQAPKGPWTYDKVLSVIVTFIVAYYAGAALGAAFTAIFGTTTATAGTTTAAVTSATASTGVEAGAVSAATTAASTALEEVVITGTVASSISVGAALTAGTVAVAAAPAILNATAPDIQVNAPSAAPAIDEVIVSGTLPVASSASVAGAITAGSVAIASAPAILSTPNLTTSTNTTAPDTLEEVTVIGTVPATSVSTVGTALAVGSVIATAAPAISSATTVSDANTTTQPDQASNADDQPSKGETLEDWLKGLVKKYGLDWVKAHLIALLKQYYGHTPTQQELDAANASLSSGLNWLVIGAAVLAALAGSS